MPGNIAKGSTPATVEPTLVGEDCLSCGLGIVENNAGDGNTLGFLHDHGASPSDSDVVACLQPRCDETTGRIVYCITQADLAAISAAIEGN